MRVSPLSGGLRGRGLSGHQGLCPTDRRVSIGGGHFDESESATQGPFSLSSASPNAGRPEERISHNLLASFEWPLWDGVALIVAVCRAARVRCSRDAALGYRLQRGICGFGTVLSRRGGVP